ncbi:MAG: peptidase MA family metallohydrolase [Chloroflexi bacterium]|nr:peptidase MA family metallohydrolase [Chloroflexota bacterium]
MARWRWGQTALDIVAEVRPNLAALIPHLPAADLALYIYPSAADLRAALRLTGRDWVGAHAHPELGVLLVTAVNSRTAASDLRQSIPHELVHFYLYQLLGPAYDSLPMWFNEGLASLAEPTPHPNYGRLLAAAVADQTTIPFSQLCERFPADEETAVLAYAQSLSLLTFIQDRYGNAGVQNLIAAFATGGDCHSGVEQALGLTLVELEESWLQSQQIRSPWSQFFFDNGFWLLLLVGGFIIAGLLVIKI